MPELFAPYARLGQGPVRTDMFLPRLAEAVFGSETCFGAVFTSLLADNEFRSSRNAPCALRGPFVRGHAALKRALATQSVVLTTDFPASPGRAALSSENHYSETRFAANGDLGTTPKLDSLPARFQRDGEKIPDGPSRAGFLTPTREGPQRGTTCSLSS